MKKIIVDDKPATKGEVEKIVRNYLQDYRSDIMTKLDQIVGELAQMREDRLFIDHDIRQLKETDVDHEERIKTLERRKN